VVSLAKCQHLRATRIGALGAQVAKGTNHGEIAKGRNGQSPSTTLL
jgi:hypothetical protein